MQYKEREKLFEQFVAGQTGLLPELLELEKNQLFDYLLRMTGAIDVSSDTIDDVYMGLADGGQYDFRNYAAFRVCLYITARKFNGDKWNADTSKLENSMFTQQAAELGLTNREQESFRAVDSSLRGLEGPKREAVILRERCGFDDSQVAQILESSEKEAEEKYMKGMQQVDADCSGVVENPEAAVRAMPGHPPPVNTGAVTMDLSMVMAGIKQRPTGLRSPFRIAMFIVIVCILLVSFLYPDVFDRWVAELAQFLKDLIGT